jgi:excisionase family DNA binding protein
MSIQEYTKEIVARYGSMFLSKKQAAAELQISECQLDRLRKSGEVKFTRVGSQIRIPASAIADFMV